MLVVVPWRLRSLTPCVPEYFDLVLDISSIFCGSLNSCMKIDFDFYICFPIHIFCRDSICLGRYLHLFDVIDHRIWTVTLVVRMREKTKI